MISGVGIVVVVERDSVEADLWRYGEAGADGGFRGDVRRYRYDPATRLGEPVDPPGVHFPTAVLLVRRAGPDETRLVYDVTAVAFPDAPPPSPEPPGGPRRWQRSTAGRAKAPGRTLGERAEQDRQPRRLSAA